MADETVDCTVVFGTDNVNHLCGYWRYYGGPSALVIGRDGERTLVVMRDEMPIARALSAADHVLGYGERGFGINLDPVTDLVAAVAAVPAVARARAHRCLVGDPRRGRPARRSHVRHDRRRGRSAPPDQADQGLGRAREDQRAPTSCAGSARRRSRAARFPARPRSSCSPRPSRRPSSRSGGPIEFLCDLLSGPNSADVCCPIHVAGTAHRRGRRSRDRGRRRSRGRVLGRHGRDPRRRGERRRARRRGRSSSTSSSRPGPSSCRARRGRGVREHPRAASSRRSPTASCRITAATRSGSRRSRTRTDPLGQHAVRALDGARGRARRVLPGPLRRAGREHLRRHARRRGRAAGADGRGSHDSRSLHHTGYTVSDLDRSLAFYRDTPRLRGDRDPGEGGRVPRRDRRLPRRARSHGASPGARRRARDRAVRVPDARRREGRRRAAQRRRVAPLLHRRRPPRDSTRSCSRRASRRSSPRPSRSTPGSTAAASGSTSGSGRDHGRALPAAAG